MDLFSCRNCVQNPTQGLSLGRGSGYCLQFGSIIDAPDRTTCKYLHRKDLPDHLVHEGTAEHAAELADTWGPVDLITKEQLLKKHYSEQYAWDNGQFDPALHAMALYHRPRVSGASPEPVGKWRLIQSYAGSTDARRALAYSSLIRRYMRHCDSWTSSYRLVLAQVEEVPEEVVVTQKQLVDGADANDARWEVLFCRLSALQEFGWHASLATLKHPLDGASAKVADGDWSGACSELAKHVPEWRTAIIERAKEEGVYFASHLP